ncbi:MAG: Ldh family oxidoreductase [Anaerolineae bacterium]|nr:Ldh family oxidoreductase [Anaerolineae bacterium]
MNKNEIKMPAERWREITRRIFRSWEAPDDVALCVADSLVGADLAGVYSHGVLRIPHYYSFIQAGWLRPANRPEVIRESPSTAVIDGKWGFGQPAAHQGLDMAMAKAREQGIAAVGITQSGHIGRLGEYMERATAAGMVALMAASGGPSGGLMVPYGGAERVLSTNPIAAGVPAREHTPFVMDFATSVVAAGKIELMPDPEMQIPVGWALDAQGQPATTVRAFREGGAILPFGGHKGYALALLVELLCGALTGAGVTERPQNVPRLGLGGNATLLIVIDIPHFTDEDQFFADVEGLFDRLHTVKPASGFDRVIIPGEPEAEQRARRLQEGFAVDRAVWDQIAAVAAERQVNLDDLL